MEKLLTTKFVESLKPPHKRIVYKDAGCDNLSLYIYPTGKKIWCWRGRVSDRFTEIRGGRFPAVDIDAARTWAAEVTEKRDGGVLVIDKRPDHEAAANDDAEPTCDWLFDLYMKNEGNLRKTAKAKLDTYNREIKPKIGSRPFAEIDYDDLAKIIADKAKSSLSASDFLQALITRWFRWATTKGRPLTGLKVNPAADLVKLGTPVARDRTLTLDEIRWFFLACDAIGNSFAEVLVFILHTGVRRAEGFDMPWTEFDMKTGVWTIPKERTKNGLDLVLPLPPVMHELLKARHKISGNAIYVWPGKGGETPMSGFSKGLKAIREKMEAIAAKDAGKLIEIKPWSIHDLRRTLSTGMNGLVDDEGMPRIPAHIIERIINHKLGGVAGIYNRHEYFVEKRQALALWADHLAGIRSGSASIQ